MSGKVTKTAVQVSRLLPVMHGHQSVEGWKLVLALHVHWGRICSLHDCLCLQKRLAA